MLVALEGFWALCACVGFGVVFRLRGAKLALAAFGGALGWVVYRVCGGEILGYFVATLVISAYSEFLARRSRAPASIYLAVALIPLVPGGGIYDTMERCLAGDVTGALTAGLHTVGVAGALAIGIVVVSSLVRIATHGRQNQTPPR